MQSGIDVDARVRQQRVSAGMEGQVAVVTGGGSGLGAAIVCVLAEAGAHVVAGDVDPSKATRVRETLSGLGLSVSSLEMDVADPEGSRAAVEAIREEHGRVDVLVNNAGVDRTVAFDELDAADWDRILAVNLSGAYHTMRAVFPLMRRQGGGHIVNIASTAAKRCWANAAAYHASKWGLLGLSHALHVEGRPHGVKVTAVIAGGMRTPFLLDRFPDLDPGVLQDAAHVARAVRFVLGQPDETVVPEITVLPVRETSWP